MRLALLTLAVIASHFMTSASLRVPDLNVEKLCKSRSAVDKMMREPETQSVADCVREQAEAKQELSKIWAQTDSSIRDRCEREAIALGTPGYLDLLNCLQMAEDIKSSGKGANQNRTKK